MKIPKALQPLIDDGIIDEVLRPLKSGKEASVYIVRSGATIRCAKVYKDMGQRSFQQRVDVPGRPPDQGQPPGPGQRQEHPLRPQGAGERLEECRSGRPLPAGRGRRAGAGALRLLQRRAGHGTDHRRRGLLRPGSRRHRTDTGTGPGVPPLPDWPDRAHALRRPDPRRPLRVQRAGRPRRPGDHRPAPGGERRGQQQRPDDADPGREQHLRHPGPLRARAAADPLRRGNVGCSSRRACCCPRPCSRACSSPTSRPPTWPAPCSTSRTPGRKRCAASWPGTRPTWREEPILPGPGVRRPDPGRHSERRNE